MKHRQPYHPVNPLPGISPANRIASGYRAVVPPGHDDCGGTLPYRALVPNGAVGNPTLFSIQHSTFSIPNWTYTFSAKERDPETGLSYFGSRYYSSDLSIWLSVDPMSDKYPSMSPYTYCANNPVKLVDPNGEFPIKIHKELVSNAFKLNPVGDKTLRKIQYGNGIKADVFHAFRSSTHMDNMKGTKPIAEAYQKAMSDFQGNMQAGNYVDAGENLHTIADFYSHSNYVELYQGYAEKNGLSTDAEDIRPFSEMMNDEKFMEFVNGEGGGLKTGEYSVLRHWSKDPESHYMNNLDKPTSKNGRKEYGNSNRHNAARSAAQKEINNIVKTSLDE